MDNHVLLYREIYNSLRNKIFSGEFGPGDMLPSENTLCMSFCASRETVRKGLKALENEGLVYSRMKVGYFVAAPNHSDFSLTFTESREGFETRLIEVKGIRPPENIRKMLELPSRRMVIEFSQLTTDDSGKPVAYDVKYVPYERSMPLVESEMRFTSPGVPELSGLAPFDYYTTIEVSAVGAPEIVSEYLNVKPGEPLMLIEKTFIRQDGKKSGYSLQYSKKSFGRLYGVSGPQK